MITGATPPANRPSVVPAIIGIGLAALLMLALGLWVSQRAPAENRQPEVRIISPTGDTSTAGSVALVFETTRPLELLPTGWGVGRYHLHAMVNDVERMPAARDVQPLSESQYRWVLFNLPDSARVQLVWATPSHQRLTEGASAQPLIRRHQP